MNLKNIFFSYSRADASDFALKLAVDLQQEGFNVWIDQQDIRAGTEWDLEIEKALETCDCLLFIESEKSVTSTNVLDEVYYAMDEKKMVIPVIYKDSKTPFRIKRLQHIDFTVSYYKGLGNLVHELKSFRKPAESSQSPADEIPTTPAKPFYVRSKALIIIVVLLTLIAAVAITFLVNNKKASTQTSDKTVQPQDGSLAVEKKESLENLSAEPIDKTVNEVQVQKNKKSRVETVADKSSFKQPTDESIISPAAFAGKWDLASVEPVPRLQRGTLTIEETEGNKVNITSNFQFYFHKTNDTAFFSVFNGYAGCSSCILKKDMVILDNDIAFGAQVYQILRRSEPGVGNAGDTVMSAGPNSTIRAAVNLQLVNKNTAIIKVQKSTSTGMSMGFVVKPFVYEFRFTKREY